MSMTPEMHRINEQELEGLRRCSKSAVERLVMWRDTQINSLDKLFLGLPDAWYEDPTWACENGHISKRFLKTESGDRCLCCQEKVVLVPPDTTELQVKVAVAT